jgi:hypothetical protein
MPLPEGSSLEEEPEVKNEFLGYREYDGQRCAVLKQSFSIDIPISSESESDEETPEIEAAGRTKFAGGLLFSMTGGLCPVMFRRMEFDGASMAPGGTIMRSSSTEEYIVKLLKAADAQK